MSCFLLPQRAASGSRSAALTGNEGTPQVEFGEQARGATGAQPTGAPGYTVTRVRSLEEIRDVYEKSLCF